MQQWDVIIVGAGAAGLMCAITAAGRGRRVLVVDHANKAGKKILMSGGGRCNFTNYYIEPEKYLSHNPHYCKSALSRYTQWDFIALVDKHGIPYHEKTLGQLFCDNKSSDILNMLLTECDLHGATIRLKTTIHSVTSKDDGFILQSVQGQMHCQSLVIASGGLSIPTLGASGWGYQVAEQFGLRVYPTRAGLVPFTLQPEDKQRFAELSGVSLDSQVSCQDQSFREHMLFTHRGLSGPSMLQISSYWQPSDTLSINTCPERDLAEIIQQGQQQKANSQLKTLLGEYYPKRVLPAFFDTTLLEKPLKQLTPKDIKHISTTLQEWQIKPGGTEGYRTAEVTLGGVNCDDLSSKTMAAKTMENLYFIGEVVDVTGWLGGYNFQWAWSSGWCAGQYV
tara:strand:- start:3567 stop:4745 length:1179 start_codon:yes stop_codon:yes gene_type:complete